MISFAFMGIHKTTMKKIFIIAALVAGAAGVRADESAFQASLTPDIAVQSKTTEISGLSLNIWGENPQHGVALGFVNGSTGDSSGFSWALIANYDDSYTGVQMGFVNYSKQDFKGLQWGFVNYAEKLNGVQLGLVNIVEDNGWFDQFPNKLAKGFPFFNWSF